MTAGLDASVSGMFLTGELHRIKQTDNTPSVNNHRVRFFIVIYLKHKKHSSILSRATSPYMSFTGNLSFTAGPYTAVFFLHFTPISYHPAPP
jgi:hypothetical protein